MKTKLATQKDMKKLQSKLEKKTQEIIENVECECGKRVHYILTNRGAADIESKFYVKVDLEKINIVRQDGQVHTGFPEHKHEKERNGRD